MGKLQDLNRKNTIAYDKALRVRIDYIHRLLGTKVTDVTSDAMRIGSSWVFETSEIRSSLSNLSAELNILLYENKGEGVKKVVEEAELISSLRNLVTLISEQIVSSSYSVSGNIDKWLQEGEGLRAELSSLTSNLTIALMNAKGEKKDLANEEEASFRGVQLLTNELGNFLLSFTRLINLVEGSKTHLMSIIELSNPLMDRITVFINTFSLKKNGKDSIKKLVEFLGNSQYKLNKSLIEMEKYQKNAQQIDERAFDLSTKILDAQQVFREVRASINDLGFLSDDPSMASLFSKVVKDSSN